MKITLSFFLLKICHSNFVVERTQIKHHFFLSVCCFPFCVQFDSFLFFLKPAPSLRDTLKALALFCLCLNFWFFFKMRTDNYVITYETISASQLKSGNVKPTKSTSTKITSTPTGGATVNPELQKTQNKGQSSSQGECLFEKKIERNITSFCFDETATKCIPSDIR